MKKLFNLIVDLFVAGTESKRKIGAPAFFLLLPFRTRNGSLKRTIWGEIIYEGSFFWFITTF